MHALEQNVRSVNTMVRNTTCLHADFQILVRNDGQIFHLDLDRCFVHGVRWTGGKQHRMISSCLGRYLSLASVWG